MNKINRVAMVAIAVLVAGLAWSAWTMDASAAKADMDNIPPQVAGDTVAGILTVTTLVDGMINDGECSLREALFSANANIVIIGCGIPQATSVDTITFEVEGTIMLSEELVVAAGGPLVIDGENKITVSGRNMTRVLEVHPDSTLTLQRLTVADGYIEDEDGAGLYGNRANITIRESQFLHNRIGESSHGGGFYCEDGTLSVVDSFFEGNGSSIKNTFGGGGYLEGGEAEFVRTTFLNNEIGGDHYEIWICIDNTCFYEQHSSPGGGGIFIDDAAVTIQESSFIANIGGEGGGGIFNFGELTILNSTIAKNTTFGTFSDKGGGIRNGGTLTIINSTLTENSTGHDEGGGISNTGKAYVANSIIANNDPSDCTGSITDDGHNISSGDTCGFDIVNGSLPNTDPLLGILQNNGGTTSMYPLLEGSPGIDTGSPVYCTLIDQRGMPRPMDGDDDGEAVCDMGSFEFPAEIVLTPGHESKSGEQGTTLVYTLELYNFSDQADSYTLGMGTHAWETSLSTEQIGPLEVGESETVNVAVTIPLDAVWYLTDEVTITAMSISNPGEYSNSTRLTTQAYVPPQISVEPLTLISNQLTDQSLTKPLAISNGDGVPLDYTIYPPASPLVMLLHLDEPFGATTFVDASEYSNDGTCLSVGECPTSGESGMYGSAVNFEGYDYIRVANAPSLNPQHAITIGAWILADNWNGNRRIVQKGMDHQYRLLAEDGYLLFHVYPVGRVVTALPSPHQWHHVLGLYDGTRMQLWVDGVLQAEEYMNGMINTTTDPLYIGTKYPGAPTGDYFRGLIDEVHIFDRALSPAEIQIFYSNGHVNSEIPWLSINPLSGSIPANISLPVQVSFDATGLLPGSYWTTISIASNDPLNPVVQVSVTLNVVSPYYYLPFITKAEGD